jgi:ketosteroid isomerase-like protein
VATDEPEQLVRQAYEAWNTDGTGALAPFLADAVELRDAPELPDAAGWSGRDRVLARLVEVAAAVGSGSGELKGFRSRGEDVLVTMAWQRPGDAPGEASLGMVFHVVCVAGDRITRITVFLDEAAALRAAGLAD